MYHILHDLLLLASNQLKFNFDILNVKKSFRIFESVFLHVIKRYYFYGLQVSVLLVSDWIAEKRLGPFNDKNLTMTL